MSGKVYHRSQRHDWSTPAWLFRELDREFRFTLDVCALPTNAKCDRFFTPDADGLSQSWRSEVCWMNPPYGRELPRWIAKAAEEARAGATVVALVPSRTDTAWWHDCIEGRAEVRFLRGRIVFDRPRSEGGHAAPFPSAIIVWRSPAVRAAHPEPQERE